MLLIFVNQDQVRNHITKDHSLFMMRAMGICRGGIDYYQNQRGVSLFNLRVW